MTADYMDRSQVLARNPRKSSIKAWNKEPCCAREINQNFIDEIIKLYLLCCLPGLYHKEWQIPLNNSNIHQGVVLLMDILYLCPLIVAKVGCVSE
jgi:hypothetical protein